MQEAAAEYPMLTRQSLVAEKTLDAPYQNPGQNLPKL